MGNFRKQKWKGKEVEGLLPYPDRICQETCAHKKISGCGLKIALTVMCLTRQKYGQERYWESNCGIFLCNKVHFANVLFKKSSPLLKTFRSL
jgi:hypothetical protein